MLRSCGWPFLKSRGPSTLHQRAACRSYALRTTSEHDQEAIAQARQWLSKFHLEAIPERLYDLTYSRSSGPGGQKVNKTNSKATLKLELSSLFKEVPVPLHQAIRQSPYCTTKSESIVISSDDSRKQSDNVRSCKIKLHNLILEAGRSTIPRETSMATQLRVRTLEKAADQARLNSKSMHSSKKSFRSGSSGGSRGSGGV